MKGIMRKELFAIIYKYQNTFDSVFYNHIICFIDKYFKPKEVKEILDSTKTVQRMMLINMRSLRRHCPKLAYSLYPSRLYPRDTILFTTEPTTCNILQVISDKRQLCKLRK